MTKTEFFNQQAEHFLFDWENLLQYKKKDSKLRYVPSYFDVKYILSHLGVVDKKTPTLIMSQKIIARLCKYGNNWAELINSDSESDIILFERNWCFDSNKDITKEEEKYRIKTFREKYEIWKHARSRQDFVKRIEKSSEIIATHLKSASVSTTYWKDMQGHLLCWLEFRACLVTEDFKKQCIVGCDKNNLDCFFDEQQKPVYYHDRVVIIIRER